MSFQLPTVTEVLNALVAYVSPPDAKKAATTSTSSAMTSAIQTALAPSSGSSSTALSQDKKVVRIDSSDDTATATVATATATFSSTEPSPSTSSASSTPVKVDCEQADKHIKDTVWDLLEQYGYDVSKLSAESIEELKTLGPQRTRLHFYNLYNTQSTTKEQLAALAEYCPNVCCITHCGPEIPVEGLSAFKKAISIHFRSSTITDDQVEKLVKEFPELTELRFDNCKYLTDDGIKHLGKLTKLVKLTIESWLRDSRITKAMFEHIQHLPIQELGITHASKIVDDGMPLPWPKTLQKLTLYGCNNISSKGQSQALAKLPELKEVTLYSMEMDTISWGTENPEPDSWDTYYGGGKNRLVSIYWKFAELQKLRPDVAIRILWDGYRKYDPSHHSHRGYPTFLKEPEVSQTT